MRAFHYLFWVRGNVRGYISSATRRTATDACHILPAAAAQRVHNFQPPRHLDAARALCLRAFVSRPLFSIIADATTFLPLPAAAATAAVT